MDTRAIGVFDSGLGGLTALAALRRLMPEENIIYFADTANAPYGEKSPEQLRALALRDLEFLSSFGVKAILAACGTVSSSTPELLEGWKIKAFGVVEATVDTVADSTEGAVGIIATPASVKSGAFRRALAGKCPEREILQAPCPEFVRLIEAGKSSPEDKELQAAVEGYLRPMKEAGVKTLILGCTHFGIIAQAITAYMGEDTALVSASECAAKAVTDYLGSKDLRGGEGKTRFFTSGDAETFRTLSGAFLGYEAKSVEHVSEK